MWEINKTTAAVLTVDFFTPVVDDPYEFGRVAAANALSDVFAMEIVRPHVALNLLALDSELGAEVAGEILRGGADTAHAAGAFVAGGHTIDDEEPKYGLCVFGTVDPGKIVRNGGAVAGDILYLTKRIGTGIMSAAVKNGLVTQQEFRPAVESMMEPQHSRRRGDGRRGRPCSNRRDGVRPGRTPSRDARSVERGG